MRTKVLLLLVILGLMVSACQPSVDAAKTQFCTSLQGLVQAGANLKTVNKDTTVDQAKQYWAGFQAAWQNVQQANQTLKVAQVDQLQASYNQMQKEISSISGQTTLGDVGPQIQSSYTNFAAQAQSIQKVSCAGQ